VTNVALLLATMEPSIELWKPAGGDSAHHQKAGKRIPIWAFHGRTRRLPLVDRAWPCIYANDRPFLRHHKISNAMPFVA
jgi:hypothetical protein